MLPGEGGHTQDERWGDLALANGEGDGDTITCGVVVSREGSVTCGGEKRSEQNPCHP